MTKLIDVIVELDVQQKHAFENYALAAASVADRDQASTSLLGKLAGLGIQHGEHSVPIPMLSDQGGMTRHRRTILSTFALESTSPDVSSVTTAIEVAVPKDNLERLAKRSGVKVWPSSVMTYFAESGEASRLPLAAVDCQRSKVASVEEIRELLRVDALWKADLNGEGIVVAVVDEGIHGATYPIGGGYDALPARMPGNAAIGSHGSMCAADILVCAPGVTLLDYPMLGATSGDALRMYQHMLDLKRSTGTPHLSNNSYGFTFVPDKTVEPDHEVHDLNHPFHRKVREAVAAGIACFFAAGNCGMDCPVGYCDISSVGPGKSIHGTNSLEEVITVAAVNKSCQRIGYSSQGPGLFTERKPDIASFSHFHAHLGPGRPGGGGIDRFDDGTSAATPLAVGVAALLLQAFPGTAPARLKQALQNSAWRSGASGWDRDHGYGIIDALSAWTYLQSSAATS